MEADQPALVACWIMMKNKLPRQMVRMVKKAKSQDFKKCSGEPPM